MDLRRFTLAEITAQAYFEIIILSLGLLYLVFDTSLATIYWIIIGADFLFYYFNTLTDGKVEFPIERRTDNRLQSLITAVIAYGLFLVISTVLVRTISPQSVAGATDYMSVIKLMATSVPIFSGSMLLSLYAFGFMIPAVESSLFFGRVMERVKSAFESRQGKKIAWNQFSVPMVLTILTCMAIFTLYHLGSKGLANLPLFVTAIFAIVSCLLVLKDRELKSAIALHCLSNSLVILSSFKII